MERRTDRKRFIIALTLIWVVQMTAAFYFCTQKYGFYEDEYYTYYSTARTNGFYVEDGKWMDRDTYRDEFVVRPDQRFQYGMVKLVQSWDVHPPLYYWVFHTAASLVPGVFSKWIGLSVNLLFHGINIALFSCLAYAAAGKNARFALFAVLFWGIGPAVMSGVVFIRMYEMLTTFVLLCALWHVCAARDGGGKLSPGSLGLMAAVTYLGFLTQYYYFIFLFFMAAAFCLWLVWKDRNIRNCVRYGISQGAALAFAWLTYPACLGQMFRGQRGAQATGNFFDWTNTADRIGFFCDLMNRYVFGRLLPLFAVLIALSAIPALRRRLTAKKDPAQTGKTAGGRGRAKYPAGFWMLLFAGTGYFLTVSKTALLLGDTSNRYQLPIYGIAVIAVLAALDGAWQRAAVFCAARGMNARYARIGRAAVMALGIVAVLSAYRRDGVLFLYPEDRGQTEFAAEIGTQKTPVVWLYQPGEEWCIWDTADELLCYPKVYFAAAKGGEPLADSEIEGAKTVTVYLTRGADAKEQLGRIRRANPGLTSQYRVFQEKYCDVWVLGGDALDAD